MHKQSAAIKETPAAVGLHWMAGSGPTLDRLHDYPDAQSIHEIPFISKTLAHFIEKVTINWKSSRHCPIFQ
jgi:hypothetical protein